MATVSPTEMLSSTEGSSVETVTANFTRSYKTFVEFQAAFVIKVILGSVIMLMGTTGNVLSFLVMRSPEMRKSTTSTYLSALSIMDLGVLYLACLPEMIFTIMGYQRYDYSNFTCRWLHFVEFVTTDTSAWILMSVSIERLLSVFKPFTVKRVCTHKSALIVVVVTFVILCGVNSQLIVLKGIGPDGSCAPLPQYMEYWENVWLWWDMCNFSILPSTILTACNVSIIIKLKFATKIKGSHSKNSKMSSNTIIMILVTIAFFMTTFPSVLFQNLKPLWYTTQGYERAKDELTWAFFLMLSYMNSAINFFLYCVSGRRFRTQLCLVLRIKPSRVEPAAQSTIGGCDGQPGTTEDFSHS
ncbi:mu-type opioid receptor-like [Tubulanus polymorphus]|uniref:mu-type opioid receptor-like n=1 Tax=Tubulanus polymorphus TaxID=672921 RepID=UPI003DA69BA1